MTEWGGKNQPITFLTRGRPVVQFCEVFWSMVSSKKKKQKEPAVSWGKSDRKECEIICECRKTCVVLHSFFPLDIHHAYLNSSSIRSPFAISVVSTKAEEKRQRNRRRMGSLVSSLSVSSEPNRWLSSSLQPSQLVYRQTLSTCYDAIFDTSFSSTKNLILVSDDGRLRLFEIDLDQNQPLIELNASTTKVLPYEQVQDILWSTSLDRFLVLTSKRLATYDQENNLVDLDLQLEKGLFLITFLLARTIRFRKSTLVANGLLVNTSSD